MEIWAFILTAAAVLFVILWFMPSRGRKCRKFSHENFFAGQDNIVLSWTAPPYGTPSNLSYQWTFCQNPAASCDPNPANWSAGIQTSMSPTGTIDSTMCPNFLPTNPDASPTSVNTACEFGATLTYAVRAVDSTTGVQSPWAIQTIDLTSSLSGGSSSITDPATSAPLTASSAGFVLTVANVTPPAGSTSQGVVTVFQNEAQSSGAYATYPIPIVFSGTTGTGTGSFSDTTIWQQGLVPDAFSIGDTVTGTVLVASATEVYYSSTFTVTISNAPVNAPTNLSWSVASA